MSGDMVFCFGANELGRHGGGAARDALAHGAIYGQGFGPQGNAFGIPTCSKPTNDPDSTISPETLRYYIYCFILYAKMHPELTFKVTRIGCGLAGWADAVVAPLFAESPDNCLFDEAWNGTDPAGNVLLPGRKYWGTYGQIAVLPTTAVPPTSATIDNDPLSLTDGMGTVTLDGINL